MGKTFLLIRERGREKGRRGEGEGQVRRAPHLSLLDFQCFHVRMETWSCSTHLKALGGGLRESPGSGPEP